MQHFLCSSSHVVLFSLCFVRFHCVFGRRTEVVEGVQDPLVQELTHILPEWGDLLQKRYFMASD